VECGGVLGTLEEASQPGLSLQCAQGSQLSTLRSFDLVLLWRVKGSFCEYLLNHP
jgi:hypothetical protein